MQKANTNAYDQRTDDVSQFVNVDKAQQIGALDGFTFSLAERIAKQSKERNFARDVMSVAFRGTEPYQLMNNLENQAVMADQTASVLKNEQVRLRAQLASISPEQADDTNYRAALGAYEQMLRNIPQAPQLERFGFSDTDKMMIGFALLMGANPADAIGKFVQTKMGFMDIQNRQTQDQFQIDQSLYRDQLRGLGDIVDIENQRLNRDQFSLDRQFGLQSQNINRELNAVNQAIDDDRLRLQNLNQVTNQRRQTLLALFDKEGVSGPNYANTYRQFVLQEAKDRGIAPEEAERLLISIAPGTKTQQTLNQEATQALNKQKFDLSVTRFANADEYRKKTFGLQAAREARQVLADSVRNAQRIGVFTENDAKAYEQLRNDLAERYQIDANLLPTTPAVGQSWQVLVGQFDAQLKKDKFDFDQDIAARNQYYETVLKPLETAKNRAIDALKAENERFNSASKALQEAKALAEAKNAPKEAKDAYAQAQAGMAVVRSAQKKRNDEAWAANDRYEKALKGIPLAGKKTTAQPPALSGNLNTNSNWKPGDPLPDQDGNINPADPNNVTQDFNFNATDEKVKKDNVKRDKPKPKPAPKPSPKPAPKPAPKNVKKPANDTKYGDFK